MVYVITDVFFCAVCVYVLPVGVIACIIKDALPYGDKDNVRTFISLYDRLTVVILHIRNRIYVFVLQQSDIQ